MTRTTWRNIFIGIIILTIPCYLIGIFVWFSNGGGVAPTPTPSQIPSRTPIDVTVLALTDPSLIVTEPIPTGTFTATPLTLNLTPIIPTIDSGVGGVTVVPVFSPTAPPTRFLSPTPTTPVPVTNTPILQSTSTPTTQAPILVPPTDTPSP